MINSDFISHCKDHVVIVNTSSFLLVNEQELLYELNNRRELRYASDVFPRELIPTEFNFVNPIAQHPRVHSSCHIQDKTEQEIIETEDILFIILKQYAEHGTVDKKYRAGTAYILVVYSSQAITLIEAAIVKNIQGIAGLIVVFSRHKRDLFTIINTVTAHFSVTVMTPTLLANLKIAMNNLYKTFGASNVQLKPALPASVCNEEFQDHP